MTIVLPVAIPNPTQPLPDPANRSTFSPRKLEHLRWERENLAPGVKALADATLANAQDAQGSATTASSQAGTATTQAGIATTQASNAAASAASALNAPGTSATSATSMASGGGSKSFTLAQTGKAFAAGQWVTVTDTTAPTTNWMLGVIATFNPGTGAMTVTVSVFFGSATSTAWAIAGSAPAQTGAATAQSFTPTGSAIPVNGMYLPAVNTVAWATNSLKRLEIDAAGRAGLGAAPMPWAAGFKSLAMGQGASIAGNDSTATFYATNIYHDGTNYRARVAGGGAFYHQSATGHQWYVAPSVAAGAVSAPVSMMLLDASGNLTTAANIVAYSDERLKTNWRDLPPGFVDQLAAVKTGVYDRTDQKATQVGVSAQSLQKVMPHAVLEQEDGMLAVAYGNAALVACVMLAREVQALQTRLAAAGVA